ncbi:MAG TPA: hypothetical protein GXX26_12355 [Clostridiaceae bacterium]|nr:hypothetical protein [Clostridiaceae bacterium]
MTLSERGKRRRFQVPFHLGPGWPANSLPTVAFTSGELSVEFMELIIVFSGCR